jgi:hypothetical protein
MKSLPPKGVKPRVLIDEVVEVTDEDDTPTLADDPQNYDFDDEDVQMSSPEPPIVADTCNYDPG